MMSECRENYLYGLPFGGIISLKILPGNYLGQHVGVGESKTGREKSPEKKMERRKKELLAFCPTVSSLIFFPLVSTFPHHPRFALGLLG